MIDKEVLESEKILDNYKQSNRTTWSKEVQVDRGFVASRQWEQEDSDSLEAANQPALCINEVTPARDQVVAALTKNSPRWMAYGREKSDVTIAQHISSLMEYIWQNSDGDEKNSQATEDIIDTGMWAMMAYYDPYADFGNGEIMITDIDPLELYIDPNSKRIDTEDAAHKIIHKRCTEAYIKTNYPDFDITKAQESYYDDIPETSRAANEGQISKVTEDLQHRKFDIIDRYTKVKVTRYHVKDRDFESVFTDEQYREYWQEDAIILTSADQEEFFTGEDAKFWINILNQYGDTIHYEFDPQSPEPKIVPGVGHPAVTKQIELTNKGYLIEQGIIKVDQSPIDRIKRVFSIGRQLVYPVDIMQLSLYPIVTTMNHFQRNPFPLGDIRLIRPLQEQLNKISSKITAYISAITNLTAFTPKGSGMKKQLEEQMGKSGMKIFEIDMDLGGQPVFAQYPPMPAGIFEDRQRIIGQIQRIIGAYPMLDGDSSQAPETYKATLVIQEEGQNRSQYKRKRIERGINNLAKVIMEMIPYAYKKEKVIRLLKPNNLVKEVSFNVQTADKIINDLSIGKYDCIMVSGSMLPTNRWARSEYYTGLFEKGILQDASVILRESEIEDVEEIIQKQDKLNQAVQYIAQLEEQIKNLSGDAQTRDRENLHLRQKVEVEKTKTGLKAMESELKSKMDLSKMRLSDANKQQNRRIPPNGASSRRKK